MPVVVNGKRVMFKEALDAVERSCNNKKVFERFKDAQLGSAFTAFFSSVCHPLLRWMYGGAEYDLMRFAHPAARATPITSRRHTLTEDEKSMAKEMAFYRAYIAYIYSIKPPNQYGFDFVEVKPLTDVITDHIARESHEFRKELQRQGETKSGEAIV